MSSKKENVVDETIEFLDKLFSAHDTALTVTLEFVGRRAFRGYDLLRALKMAPDLNKIKGLTGMVKSASARRVFDGIDNVDKRLHLESAAKVIAIVALAWAERNNIERIYTSPKPALDKAAEWSQEVSTIAGRAAMWISPAGAVAGGAKTIYFSLELFTHAIKFTGGCFHSPRTQAAADMSLKILERADVYVTSAVNATPDFLTNVTRMRLMFVPKSRRK